MSPKINLDFDTSYFRKQHPNFTDKDLIKAFDDSLVVLANLWQKRNPSFTIEVYEGLFMTYYYNDSKEIEKLEAERDSLISLLPNILWQKT